MPTRLISLPFFIPRSAVVQYKTLLYTHTPSVRQLAVSLPAQAAQVLLPLLQSVAPWFSAAGHTDTSLQQSQFQTSQVSSSWKHNPIPALCQHFSTSTPLLLPGATFIPKALVTSDWLLDCSSQLYLWQAQALVLTLWFPGLHRQGTATDNIFLGGIFRCSTARLN